MFRQGLAILKLQKNYLQLFNIKFLLKPSSIQTSEFDSSDEEPIEDEQTPIQISWYVSISDQ